MHPPLQDPELDRRADQQDHEQHDRLADAAPKSLALLAKAVC
jgi:hypothetical protein